MGFAISVMQWLILLSDRIRKTLSGLQHYNQNQENRFYPGTRLTGRPMTPLFSLKKIRLTKNQMHHYAFIINFPGTGNGRRCFGSFRIFCVMLYIILSPVTGINGLEEKKNA